MAIGKAGKHGEERESGRPGGGAGRKDKVVASGVYSMSGPQPPGGAPLVWPGALKCTNPVLFQTNTENLSGCREAPKNGAIRL